MLAAFDITRSSMDPRSATYIDHRPWWAIEELRSWKMFYMKLLGFLQT